ncbi:MAG: slipin family protein [Marmoricola sp.]|nr:slipin family protein [Marmoricola sp.]
MTIFRITIQPWERALARRPGVSSRVLEPGRHWRRPGVRYQRLDVRERLDQTAPQEVLTADGVTVKATAVVRWRIGDPVRFTEATADPSAVVYLAVRLGLRDAVARTEAEALVRSPRAEAVAPVQAAAVAAGEAVGIEVREVVLKDLVLPAELRAAYAAVVTGRQHGVAQLEAARAETAALRSLANGAKLLDEHPALARLRTVEALPPGATVKLR